MAESLREHANAMGANIHLIIGGKALTTEEKDRGVCAKCGKPATHLSNFVGTEKLLCDEHAAIFRQKNGTLPPDMHFCKKLN